MKVHYITHRAPLGSWASIPIQQCCFNKERPSRKAREEYRKKPSYKPSFLKQPIARLFQVRAYYPYII